MSRNNLSLIDRLLPFRAAALERGDTAEVRAIDATLDGLWAEDRERARAYMESRRIMIPARVFHELGERVLN